MTVEEIKGPEIDHRPSAARVTKWGIRITVIWATALIALVIWKREGLWELDLNEWGDFLAGVAAPVALLWLVLGYFQQGIELRQNTAALQLQYEELKRQVQETAELAKNSGHQAVAAGRQAVAAENLVEINRNSASQAAEQVEASYRPIFSYTGAEANPSGRHLHFTNIGATVSTVNMVAVDEGSRLQRTELGHWESSRTQTVTIPANFSFPIVLKFQFTNGLGANKAAYLVMPEFGKIAENTAENVEPLIAAAVMSTALREI